MVFKFKSKKKGVINIYYLRVNEKRGIGSCNKVETRMGEWVKGYMHDTSTRFHGSKENTLESQPKLR